MSRTRNTTTPEAPELPDALRFTGDGSLTVRGIPPLDLTADMIATLGPVNVQRAIASGLYEAVTKAAASEINQPAESPERTNDEGDGAPGEQGASTDAGKDS